MSTESGEIHRLTLLLADKDAELETLRHNAGVHGLLGDQLKEERRKHADTQKAFEYAIHRYWKCYDQYGPYWRLFAILAVVVEGLDAKGIAIDPAHFYKFVKEAKVQLAQYSKWVKDVDEVQTYFRMEDEMILLRQVHQTALDLLRKT